MTTTLKDIPHIVDATPQQIKDIAMYIKRNVILEDYTTKEEYYENKFPRFKKKYPSLYDLSCSNAMEMGEFNRMLSIIITKFQNQVDGNIDPQTNSKQMGQILYDKYVKDKEQFMVKKEDA